MAACSSRSNDSTIRRVYSRSSRYHLLRSAYLVMQAWERYLEKYEQRQGRDVLFQVAVTNRRSVESYRQYQDECVALADAINARFRHPEYTNWRPIKFETDGKNRHVETGDQFRSASGEADRTLPGNGCRCGNAEQGRHEPGCQGDDDLQPGGGPCVVQRRWHRGATQRCRLLLSRSSMLLSRREYPGH